MNCRDFLIEFEDRRGELTEAATLHVKVCAECQKTSGEQTRVWLMIDEMPRLSAPNNFDFRVKARIAQGRPAEISQPSRLLPILRYAVPLGLAVLILGIFAFNTSIFFGDRTNAPIAKNASPAPTAAASPAMNFSNPETTVASNDLSAAPQQNPVAANVKPAASEPETEFAVVNSTRKIPTEPRRKTPPPANSGSGSRDIAVTQPESPLLPLGISPNRNTEIPQIGNTSNPATDVQILDFIGITTTADNGGKKVKSVKPESLADRSGVKIGDVIEAIDNRKIGGEPMRMQTFEAKKLTVMRDAKRIEIVLGNPTN